MADIASPHDRFFKRMLSGRATAQSFLRRFLPDTVAADLDLPSLEPTSRSFVDPALREHFTDLTYRAKLRDGRDAYIYVLLEHKSRPDRLVGLQLLRYISRLWADVAERRRQRPLPALIPIVFHHGRHRWRTPTELSALVDGPDELRRYSPDFQYVLVDIGAASDDEPEDEPLLAVTILLLHHAYTQELKRRLHSILALLDSVLDTPEGGEACIAAMHYVSAIGVSEGELREAVAKAFPGRGERVMATWLDKYFEEGVERGIEQGIQQGSVITAQKFLLDVLTARFGSIPAPLVERIRTTNDVGLLSELVRIATTADSVETIWPTVLQGVNA